jgi:hypothetical protein
MHQGGAGALLRLVEDSSGHFVCRDQAPGDGGDEGNRTIGSTGCWSGALEQLAER